MGFKFSVHHRQLLGKNGQREGVGGERIRRKEWGGAILYLIKIHDTGFEVYMHHEQRKIRQNTTLTIVLMLATVVSPRYPPSRSTEAVT